MNGRDRIRNPVVESRWDAELLFEAPLIDL